MEKKWNLACLFKAHMVIWRSVYTITGLSHAKKTTLVKEEDSYLLQKTPNFLCHIVAYLVCVDESQ